MQNDGNATGEATRFDRRKFMVGSAALAIAVSGSALICAGEAWGLDVKNLKPETMRTLIKMARDIYPHDRIADKFYAVAVKGFDETAGTDAATKALVESGATTLDGLAMSEHGMAYVAMPWEAQRVALLREIENGPFFQKIRSGLIATLYNQEAVWPIFGYEGESASKGGYINRGFNDITWL